MFASLRRPARVASCCVLLGLALPAVAFAQSSATLEPYQEYDKRIRASEQVAPLGSDLFGERVNMYNRQTSFEHTDIDVPGNHALPVQLRRRLEVRPRSAVDLVSRPFAGAGDWDIDVPYITGVFDSAFKWNTTASGATPRCSTNFYPHTTSEFNVADIWSGYSVNVPGRGSNELMGHPDAAHRPTDTQVRRWLTREFDTFACVPMSGGYPGEGFLMTTTSGVTYRFDVGRERAAGMMGQSGTESTYRPRTQVYLLASRIEDRFGNWVAYEYNGEGHPTRIHSSDGREIVLSYSNNRLVSASAHGRTWTYAYTGDRLSRVTLPDSKHWAYSYIADMRLHYPTWDAPMGPTCAELAPLAEAEFGLSVTHPTGATGLFEFRHSRHFRSGVSRSNCQARPPSGDLGTPHSHYLAVPNYFDVFSLTRKTVSGAGLAAPMVWHYASDLAHIPLWAGMVPPCATCRTEKIVTVTNPDGSRLRETYGILFAGNEGRLL